LLVNEARAGASEPVLNSSGPTETLQALYSLPQADYNAIDSGSNGYTAESGYNLVTGLGTPAANLLVPDLAAYQGAGTTYSGAGVGPLQDASLSDVGSGGGGTLDVFSVFDAMTVGRGGVAPDRLAQIRQGDTGAGPARTQPRTAAIVERHLAASIAQQATGKTNLEMGALQADGTSAATIDASLSSLFGANSDAGSNGGARPALRQSVIAVASQHRHATQPVVVRDPAPIDVLAMDQIFDDKSGPWWTGLGGRKRPASWRKDA
jgi:hypothetical protein